MKQYMILLANVWSATAKYILNTIDLRSEEAWEQKSIYVFYVELAAGSSFSSPSPYRPVSPFLCS
jgi:hypothetical protein